MDDGRVISLDFGAMGALPVGLLVFAIGICLGGPTGYAVNPARDLAPRVMHALLPIPGKGPSDWGYAWIPVAGSIAGALLAVAIFSAMAPVGS
jgi:glycerol uptake facilitator protein